MLEIKIHADALGYQFEILDPSDVFLGFIESLHLSDFVAKEATAQSQAESWLKKFQKSTQTIRNKMCGYTNNENP